jgi:hypothetical protein
MSGQANPLLRSNEDRWPDAGSAQRRRIRRLYDAAIARLGRGGHLPSTFAVLDALGRAANLAALHGPSRTEAAALYDWLPRRRLGRIARDISALHLKNRAAIALVKSGQTAALSKLVRWSSEAARHDLREGRGGMLVVACHVGAFFGIRAALHGIGRPVLTLRDLPMSDVTSRARALKRAVDHLRAGQMVVATIDGPGGTSTREVECLGRRIVLRRGPFMLARITGTTLIPVVCAWTRQGHLEVRVAAPIERQSNPNLTSAEIEDDMAVRTARWLDTYLRTEPQEIWLSTLRNYLAAPRADRPQD